MAMVSTPASVASPSMTDANHDRRLLSPLASITEVTVKPSGILCRKTARKMTHPSQIGNEEAGGDSDAIEEGVDHQTHQHRHALMGMDELIGMGLFAVMKMRRYRVFEQMHEEVACENAATRLCALQVRGSQAPFQPARWPA